MKNKMYVLGLLFFSCLFMRAENEKIPVTGLPEGVSFEKAIKDLNVDSFKVALEQSEPLGKRGNAILKLCKETDTIFASSNKNLCLLEQAKGLSRPLDMRLAKTGLVFLGGMVGGCRAVVNPAKTPFTTLASIAAIVYVVYDMNVYENERKQIIKEVKKQGEQLQSKLDVFKTMIKLVESHPESEQ